jgi:signal peptidase I
VLSPVRFKSAANLAWQFALLFCIVFAVVAIRPGQVSGFSMEPRIDSDEYVLINALAFRFTSPQRGEIVAFRHESSGREVYIKRVIGVPGDRVRVERGIVAVDGVRLDEPYALRDTRSFREVVVPPGNLYVLGDNRANSEDSRAWGFVPKGDVIGHAMFGVWPLSHVGALR